MLPKLDFTKTIDNSQNAIQHQNLIDNGGVPAKSGLNLDSDLDLPPITIQNPSLGKASPASVTTKNKREASRSPATVRSKKVKFDQQPCPDYYGKGICTKGELCNFSHTGAIVTLSDEKPAAPVVPVSIPSFYPPTSLTSTVLPLGLPPVPIPPASTASAGSSDLAKLAQLASAAAQNTIDKITSNLQKAVKTQQRFTASGLPVGPKNQVPGGPPMRPPHPNSLAANLPDLEPKKIHVSFIPEYLNNITKLNEHFCKFGEITNIQVDLARGSASVEFKTEAGCQMALNSDESVMNNRFIQLKQFRNLKPRTPATRGGYRGRGTFHAPANVGTRPPHPNSFKKQQETTAPTKTSAEQEKDKLMEKYHTLKKQKASDRLKLAKENIKLRQESLKLNQIEMAKRAKINLLNEQRKLLEKQISQQKILIQKLQEPTCLAAEKPGLMAALKTLGTVSTELRSRVKILESEIYEEDRRNNIEKEIAALEKALHEAATTGKDSMQLRLKLYKKQEEAAQLGVYKIKDLGWIFVRKWRKFSTRFWQ